MSEQRSPGVVVVENFLPRDTGTVSNAPSRSAIVGFLQKGPTTPREIPSWSEFRNTYGDWADNPSEPLNDEYRYNQMVDAAYMYFTNNPAGGSPLIVTRVVNGEDCTHAVLDITDESAVVDNPADKVAFTVRAANPGAWGNRIRIAVTPVDTSTDPIFNEDEFTSDFGDPTPVRFNLYVYYTGRRPNATTELVERFLNLSLNAADRTYIGTTINNTSQYIVIGNIAAGSALNPTEIATTAPSPLTGGSDGSAPTLGDFTESLAQLDDIPQSLVLTIPGCTNAAIVGAATTYCTTRGDSFCIIGAPDKPPTVDSGDGTVLTWAASVPSKSAFSGIYYPDVWISDPQAGPSGSLRPTSCAGAVLGAFSANDYSTGVWHTPAGTGAFLRGVAMPTRRLSQAQLSALNSASTPINVIRRVNTIGTCIMGGRTLNQLNADRYVGVRRSLSYINSKLKDLTEFALFEPNGPELWNEVKVRLENWLGLYYQQGALRGSREPEAFYVICDTTNNTPATIQNGEMHVTVGVAVEYPTEFIIINLTQSQGTIRVS